MSKAVLISIQPKWCEKIANGRKTMELRKTVPIMKPPFKCYIYCTKGNLSYPVGGGMICHNSGGMVVIGEFMCDWILPHCEMANADIAEHGSLVRREKILQYANGKEVFGWHISDLQIYDKPKNLREFTPACKYGEDGECAGFKKVGCPFQKRDFNPGGSVNIVSCTKRVNRPPQSWFYVEELPGGDG